jgi:hypothetical protein
VLALGVVIRLELDVVGLRRRTIPASVCPEAINSRPSVKPLLAQPARLMASTATVK